MSEHGATPNITIAVAEDVAEDAYEYDSNGPMNIFLGDDDIVSMSWFSIYSIILLVLSWRVLYSDDKCDGQMHTFFFVVAVSSTVQATFVFSACFILCCYASCIFLIIAPYTAMERTITALASPL